MIQVSVVEPKPEGTAEVGRLAYGACVRFCGHIYIKVSKVTGSGLSLEWTKNHCILLNPKYGTLRKVHGGVVVEVMDAGLSASLTKNVGRYLK